MARHPPAGLLDELFQHGLDRRQVRRIVRHLLSGCSQCLPHGPRAWRSQSYEAAFASALEVTVATGRALAAERAEAPELLRELAVQPFFRQWIMITDNPRFRTWGFCEVLLDACTEWGFRDPPRALQAGRLGVEVADRLDRERYGGERVDDMRARAWATLGNAERILTDFRAAEKTFSKAERLIRSGTGDPLEKARLLLFEASLRGNQQRFAEAFRLLRQVIRISRRLGDDPLCGRAMITQGFLAAMAQEPERAIRYLQEGLPLIDAEAEPRLGLAARHNLIVGLTDSGRTQEALALLEESRPLYERIGDPLGLVRMRWVEGRIALCLGDLAGAEALLVRSGKILVEHGQAYDAALLSLDLAQVYARQARSSEMRALAAEMLPIFQSREIRREALSALLVFQKAAAIEGVTLSLLRDLRAYLQESRSTPGLRFRDPF
jgi:tetratricopeptide (TPR) repeat protein